ncbi:MAG: hypothetical protein WA324_07835 [Bryobacteraceae bacterium]
MVITLAIVEEFKRLARTANTGIRFEAKTAFYQTESSLRSLYLRLEQARTDHQDITLDTIKPLIAAIETKKQRKYSAAIKYVEKTVSNQATKIFATLREDYQGQPLSEKLSKSQQRYTIPLLEGDAGHGLCFQMSLLWLVEQFNRPSFGSSFPRLADGNVVGSKSAIALTQKALAIQATGGDTMVQQAGGMGLTLLKRTLWGAISFENFQRIFQNHPDDRAFVVTFWEGQHVVSIFRENDRTCQFYDANAGSYRVAADKLNEFLRRYNNVCLPLKWPVYAQPVANRFTEFYTASNA